MNLERKPSTLWPWGVILLSISAAILTLRWQGRFWWCSCGQWNLWNGDIWSAHNSQHLFDPYSFTHFLHGILFYWLMAWLLRRAAPMWQLAAALGLEALWEVVENSPFIIQRYREGTIGLGYEGDSIVNSLGDILCCAAGFLVAQRLRFRRALLLFVCVELLLLICVRDNLTLNVMMLLYPIDAVRAWQMGHP